MILFTALLFVFGIIIGSFINVLVVRGHNGESILGRSHCVHCHEQIPKKYLIPILGYLLSGRRCFSCKKTISPRYLIGEISLGLIYVVLFLVYTHTQFITLETCGMLIPCLISQVLFIKLILVTIIIPTIFYYISYYDILYQEIPTMSLLVLVCALLAHMAITGDVHVVALLGLLVCIPFLLVWIISRGRLIGFGDILIMALMGLHLGITRGFSAVIIAFWLGSIFGIMWILIQKYLYGRTYQQTKQIPLPFGPFLFLGWLLVLIGNISIFQWFL